MATGNNLQVGGGARGLLLMDLGKLLGKHFDFEILEHRARLGGQFLRKWAKGWDAVL
ncbi:hypothetical protein DC3_31120 [Deinococcus cellulosilyticus NBRC 106333 = KACC 11606]|uniref:Uncharacterized protein n=1 Tax=Deinococcus cellulosilyticus (strain DSM 18568 / NBRC 106333 / KACC 11606 / 5516J-15) TaxID=1223518 RepID=A0A511N4T3_DEIC1|nr:hypothetical protein DC3_31120 [Deinococcus cellulosilyticus NBRC 106333 = KACC 11606]